MYRFSFVENVGGKANEVNRELFHEIIRRERVRDICAKIAELESQMDLVMGDTEHDMLQENVGRLKKQLPAFCWHAWFDDGRRSNSAAHASGLIMMDLDHVGSPRQLYNKVEPAAKANGLLAAHVTPSTRGLRLIFPVPAGMDIVSAQSYYVKLLGLSNVDACTKDLARLSFCVPEGYWLWVDEEGLFEGEEASIPQPLSPKGKEEKVSVSGLDVNTKEEEKRKEQETAKKETYPEYYGTPVTTDSSPFGGGREGALPYTAIVDCLQTLLGGVPAHGSRNNFIFSMASYLRYVCNDDPDWIASVLPTYGETSEKWRRTIDSACQRAQYKDMPQIVRRAIANARKKMKAEKLSIREGRSEDCPPEMPSRLPRLIQHLVKNVPEVCRPAVANAVFPALGAHLHGVKFWLIDGTEKEPTFMCVTMAKQSSGKSAVNKPIEYIIADIVARDELSRQREQEWKDAVALKGANKEKPKRPDDLCVQVLVSDMTNAAFVQRLKDAGDRYLYTNLEELDLLKQLQTNGTRDVGKILCLCYDNGRYGQERVGTQSVTARVAVRWNWNAASTIQKGLRFFEGRLVDGTLSRLNFCTIIPDKSKPFVYGKYDEKYAETLKPYIDNLNLATGSIQCRKALQMAQRLQDECTEVGALSDDDVYQDLSYRAVTIAYLKAMVLYIAGGMRWGRDIEEFAEWSLKYDLWCKCHFFGDGVSREKSKERVKSRKGPQNLLDMLPETFTLQDAIDVRKVQDMDEEGTRQMLYSWVFRKYVTFDKDAGRYMKTQEYMSLSPALP